LNYNTASYFANSAKYAVYIVALWFLTKLRRDAAAVDLAVRSADGARQSVSQQC